MVEKELTLPSTAPPTLTEHTKGFNPQAVSSDIVETKRLTAVKLAEHTQLLSNLIQEHQSDPNFPEDILCRARSLLEYDSNSLNPKDLQELAAEIEAANELLLNDSPYPEVRAVVPPTDEPSLPVNTFRVFILGTIFTILGTGIDQFFAARQPGIYISSSIAQLISFPCGVAMARYLPARSFGWGRWSFSLNPGPFNQKEHILIIVMSNVAYGGEGTAYVTYVFQLLQLDFYFGEKILANSAGFQILLGLATQFLGYGSAGLTRRFLVYPSAMIWPNGLAQIALNRALHNDNGRVEVPGWRISRYKFFMICFFGMFAYFWLPDYLFNALATFNWMTWIDSKNITLALITGSLCGLGLNPLPTFDWNTLSSLADPIKTPFFSIINVAVGMAIASFFVAPLIYWYDVWNTSRFTINSNSVFDNTGSRYNVSRVLNPDYTLNTAEYEVYGAPYLSATFAMMYASFFAAYLSLITYVLLNYWKELKAGIRSSIKWKDGRDGHEDIHNRLMRAYKEVPDWWYGIVLAISFTFACIACASYPTGMPIWAIVLGLAMTLVLQIPTGIILATTNTLSSFNVLSEYIAGYAIPNKVIPNLIFKVFGTVAPDQAVLFASDLKLGHYLKVPPRTMFAAQIWATFWGTLVSIGVNAWQNANIKDICQPQQKDGFTCPGTNSFFTGAVIWGVVGPKRLFGNGGLYNPLQWGFLVGALLPIPVWLFARKYPKMRHVHIPVILTGYRLVSPYNFSYIWPTCIVAYVFNYHIKRKHPAWWSKYAYVLTNAFGVGIAISAIVIFFAVQYRAEPLSWWGNEVSFSGVDGGGVNAPACVLRPLTSGEKIPGT